MSDYSCAVTQANDCFEFEDWTIDFKAEATYIHEDMVKYYRDGTGYPGCDDIEDINWTIGAVTDSDGNELELGNDNYPVNWDEETKKRCENAISSYLDKNDWDYPDDDGYPEPPEEC
jgi:hypothetical protein